MPIYLPRNGNLTLTSLDTRIVDRVVAVMKAVSEAKEKVQLNEVFRNEDDQQKMIKLYPKYANKTGISPHMVGLAFDLDRQHSSAKGKEIVNDEAAKRGFSHPTVNGVVETWHFQTNEFITRGKDRKPDQSYKAMLQRNQIEAYLFRRIFLSAGIPETVPAPQK